MKAETVMEQPASERQMAYIRRLHMELGKPAPRLRQELSRAEASKVIENLLRKSAQINRANGQRKINGPRFGMAMKECFRYSVSLGQDIWEDPIRRPQLIDRVIETSHQFTEIADRIGADWQCRPSASTEDFNRRATASA